MSKKILGIFLVLALVVSVTACGKKKSDSENTTENKLSYQDQFEKDKETYAQYVSLGQYKGLQVTVDRSTLNVTDQAVQDYINNILSENGTSNKVTTGVTKSGDSITLDYSGLLDGNAFAGGTATDAPYTVGSGKFIQDLDKGLVGLDVGKEYDIPCTFPADYSSPDLAGKSVVFKVTVKDINQTQPAEFTDDFVKSIASQYQSQATTTQEFTDFAKDTLQKNAQSTFDNSKYNLVWDQISKNSSVSDYPSDELQALMDTIENNVKSEFASYGSQYGISDYNTYLSSVYGYSTEEDFLNYAKEYAQNYLKQKMILTMIAKNENIAISDDEIKQKGEQLAQYYGYGSYDEILSTYGNDVVKEVGYSVLSDSVIKFLLDNSVETQS